ncbi:tRNA (adenosine(37)-N6)-threonylcarbamoyltransferase complex dimerization subunit type 1 TsaB [Alteromonas antoniana]|uniref:tRNA (adenosine(37)-N6)-threonylcarbamoyltransferase complex dimerization subunit type 1 TsaB n=1 Tax=Alteromonas antoniana TaxID=2803813 RepID=UPI001C48420D|nr:tRNA (adenosine(37)-N6)-threonylcarbamoyltransferase complex dimerization subunit type 1 TsaB [Alteromonas antoniana]
MTRILAIDTATEACSVALQDGDTVYSRFEICPQQHSQKLLPMVDDVLKEAGLSLSELDCLAYGRGPGSFTGVRIATGMIQGLALGTGLRVVSVSTLAAMAWEAAKASEASTVYTAIDARMGEVYFAAYQKTSDSLESLVPEKVCPPEEAFTHCKESDAVVAGTGWAAYEVLSDFTAKAELTAGVLYPAAEAMLPLANASLLRNEAVLAADVEPVYLRDKVTWKKLPGRE